VRRCGLSRSCGFRRAFASTSGWAKRLTGKEFEAVIKTFWLIGLAAAVAAPGAAQEPTETGGAVRSETATEQPEAVRALQALDLRRLETESAYAASIVGHIEEIDRLSAGGEGQLGRDSLRMYALITAGRRREAAALLERLAQQPYRQAHDYGLLWYGALRLEDYPRAVALIEQASRSVGASDWPALRGLLERGHVWMVMRHFNGDAGKPTQYRFAESLLRFGWPGHDDPGTTDSLRLILIEQELAGGDDEAAQALASMIATPGEMVPLILMRRYDKAIGDHDRLALLRDAIIGHDRVSAQAVADRPEDLRRVLARATFLREVGRDTDALALLEPFTRDVPATVAQADEGMWLINQAGYALLALGRADEAVALMEKLVAIPVAERPELIGPYINHSVILWRAGRMDAALDHALQLDREHQGAANDFGRMWILSSVVCALEGLGRHGEVAPWLRRMRRLADENPAAMIRAQLCANDLDAAEALVVQMLRGDRAESAMLWFQNYETGAAPAAEREFRNRVTALRERPAVRGALERAGHILTLPLSRVYWATL
jgi:tetratricopeptide (TPR) repeat protein